MIVGLCRVWSASSRAASCGILLSCCLLLAGCAPRLKLQLVARFQQAQQAFDEAQTSEDYLRSAALYQEILDAGLVSGQVLYNQGNAFMRAGQRGRAIACYRQAWPYLPQDPRLLANLRFAAGPEASLRPPASGAEYVLFWQDWISYPGKFRLTGGLALSAFLLGLLALCAPPRQLWQRLAAGVLVLTLVSAGSAAYDWYRFEQVRRGVVIAQEVVARQGNAESYEAAFTEPLREGMEFRLLERRDRWLQIELVQGGRGWVPVESVVTY